MNSLFILFLVSMLVHVSMYYTADFVLKDFRPSTYVLLGLIVGSLLMILTLSTSV